VPRKDNNISLYSLPLHFGKGLTGSHGGESIPNVDIPRYQNMYSVGRIKLLELLTEYIPLEDINIAIDNMRTGKTSGRCLISMN
jgi:S-(hydroxymethyl)glutathione dehydrogenase/alcohol dehydrogenase